MRINPHELSINDSEFYDKIYVTGSIRRTNNYSHFGKGIDFEGKRPSVKALSRLERAC